MRKFKVKIPTKIADVKVLKNVDDFIGKLAVGVADVIEKEVKRKEVKKTWKTFPELRKEIDEFKASIKDKFTPGEWAEKVVDFTKKVMDENLKKMEDK